MASPLHTSAGKSEADRHFPMFSCHLLNFLSLDRERPGVNLHRLKGWEAEQEVHLAREHWIVRVEWKDGPT